MNSYRILDAYGVTVGTLEWGNCWKMTVNGRVTYFDYLLHAKDWIRDNNYRAVMEEE
jgi:hypothetical protein